jgi:hypothetical protein
VRSCSLVDIHKLFKESTFASFMVCRAQRSMFCCNSITACQIALGLIECIVMNIFVLRKSKLRKLFEINRRTKHTKTYTQRYGKFVNFFYIFTFYCVLPNNRNTWDLQTKKETKQLTNPLNHALIPAISQAFSVRFSSLYVPVQPQTELCNSQITKQHRFGVSLLAVRSLPVRHLSFSAA